MKKSLFIAALFCVFLFPFASSYAQQPDAIYKLLRYEWTINADGTSDYHYRHEVEIVRNRALTAYADKGETFVVYNPDIEELTINEVYTVRPDGSRVEMPQNAFVYQLPGECADCGRFNHLRELAMVHTGMEYNCVIVVDYTIHRHNDLLYEKIPLKRDCPVEKLEVKVQYPADMEVGFEFVGQEYLPTDRVKRTMSATTDGDAVVTPITLFFELTDMPQAPNEPYMPSDIIPTLRLYNGAPEFTPSLNYQGLSMYNSEIKKLLTGSNTRENITALQKYVVNNIHLNDIAPVHLGYTHASAAEVWQTGCGTATDKALLLASMLEEAGFTARVIGENSDQVGVMIDTLEYRLDIRRVKPLELIGEAKDEVEKVDWNTTPDAVLDTLEDGFYSVTLPPLPGTHQPLATKMALKRTTPLVTTACDYTSSLTYTLPKGMKMVGSDIKHSLKYDGIGSLEISVKQSGKKLKVVRNLKVEKSLISIDEYAAYRKLIATWQSVDKVLLRSK